LLDLLDLLLAFAISGLGVGAFAYLFYLTSAADPEDDPNDDHADDYW
jgi:hypothetical protein